MTRLIVVKADEVGDRPRWWCWSATEAVDLIMRNGSLVVEVNELHTDAPSPDPDDGTMPTCAVVADDPPAPQVDADERAFWCAVYATVAGQTVGDHDEIADFSAKVADAALVEYSKRWPR